MSNRRLILHVGTHKTGTSSFQKSLKQNRIHLLERGVRTFSEAALNPDSTEQRTFNLVRLGHLFLRRSLRTSPRLRGFVPDLDDEMRAERIAKSADAINNVPQRMVIMSAESFCFLRTVQEKARLQDFIVRTGREVTVLLVLRDEVSWRSSWANQLGKLNGLRAALDAQADANRIDADWYFDRAAIVDFWSDFDLQTLQYGDSDNIVDDLFRRIGVDTTGLKTNLRANVRGVVKKVVE